MATQPDPFGQALSEYERSQNVSVEHTDEALDTLMAVPIASVKDLASKLRILAREYGDEWQSRHVKWVRADVAALARLVAA